MEKNTHLLIKGETEEIKGGEGEGEGDGERGWLRAKQKPWEAQENRDCSLLGKSWHDILLETLLCSYNTEHMNSHSKQNQTVRNSNLHFSYSCNA